MKMSRIAAKLSSFCDIYSIIKYFMNSFDCNFSSGICGIATIEQIKEGKHMYRVLETHFSMYLALKKSYMKKFIDGHLEIKNISGKLLLMQYPMCLNTLKRIRILSDTTTKMFLMLSNL